MRINDKQNKSIHNKDFHDINLHRFMELNDHSTQMEIAMELGITLGEVKQLKKLVNRA
ncbi:hypothetical protein VBD025_10140 [Virgibacillus flavescens]|uniref:hypothetical protein n=1 Tax=Virgibacillus flavescens TaxID=1611422 RepID=UPI003D3309E9